MKSEREMTQNAVTLVKCSTETELVSVTVAIGVGAQSTLRGQDILPEKYDWKKNKIPEFYMILSQNGRILHNNCPKNIFSDLLGVRGWREHVPPLPPVISYAYDCCRGNPLHWLIVWTGSSFIVLSLSTVYIMQDSQTRGGQEIRNPLPFHKFSSKTNTQRRNKGSIELVNCTASLQQLAALLITPLVSLFCDLKTSPSQIWLRSD